MMVAPAAAFGAEQRPWPTTGNLQPLQARFAPPAGFQRVAAAKGSFGVFLRELPLLAADAQVHLFDGRLKNNREAAAAVIDIDVGKQDLQQCADAVMRLHAEFRWHAGKGPGTCFRAASGKNVCFAGAGYAAYRSWLNGVFNVANTTSLRQQLQPVGDALHPDIGDVYIVGHKNGRTGHAVLVVDAAQNAAGQRVVLLAQSYMPAQQIHVLKNWQAPKQSPWFDATADGSMLTPEWEFGAGSLYRFAAK